MSTTTAPQILSDEQVQQFRRDGFLKVEGFYSKATVEQWKKNIYRDMAGDSAEIPFGVEVFMLSRVPKWGLEAMSEPRVVGALQQLVGPSVEFLSYKGVFKNGKVRLPSPWHQDWFYWEGAPKISIWIALDDATPENGCLKFIPGSHKKVFNKTVAKGEGFVNRIRDEDLGDGEQLTVPCKAGDAVFFHDLAVHASHPNTAGVDRWSLISTYRDAATKDSSRTWERCLLLAGHSVNGGEPLADVMANA